jgi:hypothetical protein
VLGSLCYCANLRSLIPRLFWFGNSITNRSLLRACWLFGVMKREVSSAVGGSLAPTSRKRCIRLPGCHSYQTLVQVASVAYSLSGNIAFVGLRGARRPTCCGASNANPARARTPWSKRWTRRAPNRRRPSKRSPGRTADPVAFDRVNLGNLWRALDPLFPGGRVRGERHGGVLELGGSFSFGVDGLRRAFGNAGGAINAFVG